MAESSEQLAKLITERVLAALGHNGHAARAAVNPPPGLCTAGEARTLSLQGRGQGEGQAWSTSGVRPSPNPSLSREGGEDFPGGIPAALTGIVTAIQLKKQVGPIRLAPGARLTPAAVDYIREKKLTVHSLTPAPAPGSGTGGVAGAAAVNLPFAWWIAGACPVVEKVVPGFGGKLTPLAPHRRPDAIAGVIRDVAKRVKARQVAGGILFVSSGAVAACLANRCRSLRAVVGTCEAAVEEGVRELGANVLVIEYPQHGPRSMGAMVQRFVGEPRVATPTIDRALGELASCE